MRGAAVIGKLQAEIERLNTPAGAMGVLRKCMQTNEAYAQAWYGDLVDAFASEGMERSLANAAAKKFMRYMFEKEINDE
jgi:hypothetical protein